MLRPGLFWLLIGLGVTLISSGYVPTRVEATHETDHRFTIYGTVLDGRTFPGKPMAGQKVVVRWDKTQTILNQSATDERGRFSILIHVHNRDVGKHVSIQAGDSQESLQLEFDPNDPKTERRSRVDLVIFP